MRMLYTLAFAATLVCSLAAQWSAGPDVIVGAITGVGNYGTDGSGIYAYSLGTDACNIGNASIPWSTSSANHPVIAQHVYRLKPVAGQPYSRFEQIGMSWLKHGFARASGSLCHTCQGGGGRPRRRLLRSLRRGPERIAEQRTAQRGQRSTGLFPYPRQSYPAVRRRSGGASRSRPPT